MPDRINTIKKFVAGGTRATGVEDAPALEDDDPLLMQLTPNANAITTRMIQAIETGVFADGDKLPPERQLAVALGTARSTIRNALEKLEQRQLVVRRVGSGTFVNYSGPIHDDDEDVADLISPLQLIETRMAVEPHLTRLAAIHATGKDIDQFETMLKQIEDCGADQEQFTKLDGEFHLQLARCARNPLMMKIYHQINSVRTRAQWNSIKRVILTEEKIAAYNNEHRKIFEAIKHRDASEAIDAMTKHLDGARQDLMGVGEL